MAGVARSTNEEKIQKRVEFDLYYIENWSVLFDLYILLKTPLALDFEERERLLSAAQQARQVTSCVA